MKYVGCYLVILLWLTGTGCWFHAPPAQSAVSAADAWPRVIDNLLAVRVDQSREDLAREYHRMTLLQQIPERAEILDRMPEDAAARAEARQALETAIGIVVQLTLPGDDAAARVLEMRCREKLGREFLMPAMQLPLLEDALKAAAAADVPPELMARHRMARDDAAMRLRTLMGLPEGETLDWRPEPGFAPVLPAETDDLMIALHRRPELTGFTGSFAELAAAVRYLDTRMPPVSADPDGAAAALRAALMILRLPGKLLQRQLYEQNTPADAHYLLIAWGIDRQLKLGRRALIANDDGAAEQLRCDLGLEPGEMLPETEPPAEPRTVPAAELLLRLMAQ